MMEKKIETNYNFTYLMAEYDKLKDEQHKRIGFRDNMIFLTLGAIGTVFSFALDNPEYDIALLVLPFLCIVLGWTYLANDQKISAIGNYTKNILIPKIELIGKDEGFEINDNWEDYLNKDKLRRQRKWIQLLVDISVFCISGILSIIAFFVLKDFLNIGYTILMIFEVIILFVLAFQFGKYADVKKISKT